MLQKLNKHYASSQVALKDNKRFWRLSRYGSTPSSFFPPILFSLVFSTMVVAVKNSSYALHCPMSPQWHPLSLCKSMKGLWNIKRTYYKKVAKCIKHLVFT
uniref:Uncharacterized protein n=1 Tax=Solanum tuberosum TaxID=4113 RepID=M1A7T6_SOLTU